MELTLVFISALAASVAARPSNMSSVQGEPTGKIDMNSPRILADMRLVDGQLEQTKDAVMYFEQFRWPGGVVPFEVDRSLAGAVNILGRAFNEYHMKTCIRFVPHTNQRNYIYIFKGEGCYSNIGMINQGRQPVSLGEGCLSYGTVVHELGHAIGFFHEQNRDDRDKYVRVIWENIQNGLEDQFQMVAPEHLVKTSEYDYRSIMHYGDTAFSKDGTSKTMVRKDGGQLEDVYKKVGLSDKDVKAIKTVYGC